MVNVLLPPAAISARSMRPAPFRDGTRLVRPARGWLLLLAAPAAAAAGAATVLGPLKALAGLLVLLVAAAVWRWPSLGAYLIIGLTPVTVGISRGAALPVVRPNEAVALLVGMTLAVRGMVRLRSGGLPAIRLNRVELALVLMAVTNSVVPLLWMTVRQEPISQDDILYALVMWKFLGLYALVRLSVRTDQQVRRCLWLSVLAASVVAVLAILQSLGLLGVQGLLTRFYEASASAGLQNGRGSSTLGLPAATADLMIFNLAVVSGLWTRNRRYRLLLAGAAGLFVMGALSAGEFSSAIGLVAGIACLAIVQQRPRLLAVFVPGTLVAGYALRPVIAKRLSGFQSASGLPVSWTGRLQNLQTYFWPKLFSDWNFVLGVRPSARIPAPTQIAGYVWIESGYTWLLWGGGLPLLASFVFFIWATGRAGWTAARLGGGGRSAAGVAVFTAVVVITLLMTFDPHLTYRGSADAFYFLIALAVPRGQPSRQAAAGSQAAAPVTSDPVTTEVRP